MSIEDDIALLNRVATLRLLGPAAVSVLAIGAEQRDLRAGETLFRAEDDADAGFVVKEGAFRITNGDREVVARPGALIGELALLVGGKRGATATAVENSSAVRVSRSLFHRVLESHPEAALKLREEFAARTGKATESMVQLTRKLT